MVSTQAIASILSKKARLALGLGAAATTVYSSHYTVKSGQRAVLVNRFYDTLPESIGEGTHFLIPWIQKPYIFDVHPRTRTFSSISATSDHEPVNLTLRVIYRPDTQHLPTIVENLGVEYDKILPSIANEVLESVITKTARTNALLLFIWHPEFCRRVRDTFVQRAKDLNILIDEVHITHFSCTDNPEITRAFEQKLVEPNMEEDRSILLEFMPECRKRTEECDHLKAALYHKRKNSHMIGRNDSLVEMVAKARDFVYEHNLLDLKNMSIDRDPSC